MSLGLGLVRSHRQYGRIVPLAAGGQSEGGEAVRFIQDPVRLRSYRAPPALRSAAWMA